MEAVQLDDPPHGVSQFIVDSDRRSHLLRLGANRLSLVVVEVSSDDKIS